MSSRVNTERIYGNFKPLKGYAKPSNKTKKARDRRPGMSISHLDCIRQLHCCVCGKHPRSEVHHLKCTGERGMGLRSTDRHTVPLCRSCHDEIEGKGARNEVGWFTSRGIDALALAENLWRNTGDVDRMRKIVEAHRI